MLSQLLGEFKELRSGLNGKMKMPFNQTRLKAIESLENLGLPNSKHEEWRYSDTKVITQEKFNFHFPSNINQKDLESLEMPENEGNVLYFLNGHYSKELSIIKEAENILVTPLNSAKEDSLELINSYFGRISQDQEEGFTAMNTALSKDGVLIHIPAKSVLKEPIIIRWIMDGRKENVGAIVRNLVIVGDHAEVKVAESFRSLGEKKLFTNAYSEIFVGKNARVDYYKVQMEGDNASHIGTTQVYQEDNSYFYSSTITLDGGFVRNNLNLILDGEYIDSYMYGLYIPNKKQHVDNHTVVDHRKPNSQSNELYKGILLDSSTGVFNGKIFVRQEAQKTNAYQNCRNVVVSDSATMNTKPQLEIWADDVKCSHGTTTGQLDDEAIFYMQSRGIPKKEAMKMQMLAFANDVVNAIKVESMREYLENRINQKLGKV